MSEKLLKKHGLKIPQFGIAESAHQAQGIAEDIGYPVALKISSPDIVHKIDIGGVQLNLTESSQVIKAYHAIMESVHEKAPQAEIKGIRVEKMYSGGIELAVGLINDPQFGPSIMFGLGGIFIEVLKDVSFRVLPITRDDAKEMVSEIRSKEIFDGYRGLPQISRDRIVELLVSAGQLGMELAPRLDSVDLNPIMIWEDDHCVLDAKFLLRDEANPFVVAEPDTTHLQIFFHANSVAVVGASSTPGKIGNSVLDSLANYDYQGKVFPINPSRDEIMGIKTYASLSDVPEQIDLVVVTVSLNHTPEVLRVCAELDIHNVVIVSGGGKELGGKSKQLEQEISELGETLQIRIIGPNCIGIFDGETRLDTFFQVQERMLRPPFGPIAMLTQSGTVGAAFLEKAETIGISKFVSYGNRVDVDESDLIAYLADDPDTIAIACYIEGLADGRKWLNTARKVTQKKPLVVFKGGQTLRGARASISHTGFFGGSYEVFRGAMHQAGVILTDSVEELYAATEALCMQPRAKGNQCAMISNGAGTMVQGIDLMSKLGLHLTELTKDTVESLKSIYPPYYVVQNPLDVTGSATSEDYRLGIERLLKDPNIDIVMPWFVFQDTPLDEAIVEKLGELSKTHDKPIICGAMGGPYTRKISEAIRKHGIPVYHTVREWMAAAYGLATEHDR